MDIRPPLISDYVEHRGEPDLPFIGKHEPQIDADIVREVEKPPLIVPELERRKHKKEENA